MNKALSALLIASTKSRPVPLGWSQDSPWRKPIGKGGPPYEQGHQVQQVQSVEIKGKINGREAKTTANDHCAEIKIGDMVARVERKGHGKYDVTKFKHALHGTSRADVRETGEQLIKEIRAQMHKKH